MGIHSPPNSDEIHRLERFKTIVRNQSSNTKNWQPDPIQTIGNLTKQNDNTGRLVERGKKGAVVTTHAQPWFCQVRTNNRER